MEYKIITAVFSGKVSEFPVLDFAKRFAELCETENDKPSVNVLFITPEVESTARYMLSGGPTISVYEEYYKALKSDYEEKEKLALANFKQYSKATNFEWKQDFGDVPSVLAYNGKFSDLIVISREIENHDVDYMGAVEASIFDSGRPVVLIPENYRAPEKIKNITFGWDGSFRAAKVIRSAIPVLQKAENVNVITIGEVGKDVFSTNDLVKYLKTHNVNAKNINVEKAKISIGETLLEKANELKSDLILIGAYTHSKMRQMVLGSVTKYMLKNTTIPVMMEH